MALSYDDIQALMEKTLNTIKGDMDFSKGYSEEELEWVYDYCVEYEPDGFMVVLAAISKVLVGDKYKVGDGYL